jgi:hypothetical protein
MSLNIEILINLIFLNYSSSKTYLENVLDDLLENKKIIIKDKKLLDEDEIFNYQHKLQVIHIQSALFFMEYLSDNEDNKNLIKQIIKKGTDVLVNFVSNNKLPENYDISKKMLEDNFSVKDITNFDQDAILYFSGLLMVTENK